MLIFLLFCMLLYTLCGIDTQLTQEPQTHIDAVIENILLNSNGGDDAGPRGIQPRGPTRALFIIEASSHALFLFKASSHKLYTFDILLDSTRGVYDGARPRGIQPRGPTEDEVLFTSNRGDYNGARPRGIRPREPNIDAASLPALFIIEASSHALYSNRGGYDDARSSLADPNSAHIHGAGDVINGMCHLTQLNNALQIDDAVSHNNPTMHSAPLQFGDSPININISIITKDRSMIMNKDMSVRNRPHIDDDDSEPEPQDTHQSLCAPSINSTYHTKRKSNILLIQGGAQMLWNQRLQDIATLKCF